jgi:YidC/Oxa1 family membrane protein insertase
MNEMLASLMSHLAVLFDGSMGWAILALALAVRLALLPLTLHLARRMRANQKIVASLEPQVAELRKRLADKPAEMLPALSALYKDNGARLFDRSSLLGALLQLPVFALLYKAIGNAGIKAGSFLWMRSLATPDAALTAIVLALTALSAYYMPSAAPDKAMLMMVVQVVATAFILWKLSAAMGLYWAASSAVSLLQSGVLRVDERRMRIRAAKS